MQKIQRVAVLVATAVVAGNLTPLAVSRAATVSTTGLDAGSALLTTGTGAFVLPGSPLVGGQPYVLHYSWQIPATAQVAAGDTFTVALPSNVRVPQELSLPVKNAGTTGSTTIGTLTIAAGALVGTVTLNGSLASGTLQRSGALLIPVTGVASGADDTGASADQSSGATSSSAPAATTSSAVSQSTPNSGANGSAISSGSESGSVTAQTSSSAAPSQSSGSAAGSGSQTTDQRPGNQTQTSNANTTTSSSATSTITVTPSATTPEITGSSSGQSTVGNGSTASSTGAGTTSAPATETAGTSSTGPVVPAPSAPESSVSGTPLPGVSVTLIAVITLTPDQQPVTGGQGTTGRPQSAQSLPVTTTTGMVTTATPFGRVAGGPSTGRLPQTGERWTPLASVIGVLSLAGMTAVEWFRRQRKN